MNAWPGWACCPHGRYVHRTQEPEVPPEDEYRRQTDPMRKALCGARVYAVDVRPASPYIAQHLEKCPRCSRISPRP